jgi:hypothetical protein
MADIEEAIRKLREKNQSIEKGQAPIGAGMEEPEKPLSIEPLPVRPIAKEIVDTIEYLHDLLRRTAVHISARDAMGNKSKLFCMACSNARHENCVLPEIWKAVEE